MRGRYISPTMAEMERYWALSDAQRNNLLGFTQHFNIGPTTQVLESFLPGLSRVQDSPMNRAR
jgi:hypothetical protein